MPRAVRGGRRLLIVNNLPTFYRADTHREVCDQFNRRTNGTSLVAYQSRRSSRDRKEWFFAPDAALDYPHVFANEDTHHFLALRLPGTPMARTIRDFAPTHVFTAGWDTSLSWAAAIQAKRHGAVLGLWVESNRTTTRHPGPILDSVRRGMVSAADFVVVPTAASASYAEQLAKRPVSSIRLFNPVSLNRIPDCGASPARAVFIGDLSRRKGFDRFEAAAARLAGAMEFLAWGVDVEGLASASKHVVVSQPVPREELVKELRPDDIVVIPSRNDPAPLTFSEALALGLRIVVSPNIAYSENAGVITGVTSFSGAEDPESLADAIRRSSIASRPSAEDGRAVTNAGFAERLVDELLSRGT